MCQVMCVCMCGFIYACSGYLAPVAFRVWPSFNLKAMSFPQRKLRRDLPMMTLLCFFFLEGTVPIPAKAMTSAVWINKERRSSLSPEETDSEAEGMWEEVDRGFHQPSETPWHTYLELHRLLQTFHLEAGHQGKPKGYLVEPEARFPPEGDTDCLKNNQKTQQEMKTPEEARCQSQEGCAPLQVAGSSVHCLSSTKNLRSGKAAYYPFPQRKPPRISQAARNLGLYGPP